MAAATPRSTATDLAPVIASGMCVGCGACTAADPTVRLVRDPVTMQFQPDRPGKPEAAAVCPAVQVDFADLHEKLFPGESVTEHGVVRSVWLAQSTDEQRNLRASSGGLIKELLRYYLDQPDVDGVIALAHKGGLEFEPRLIRDASEIDRLPGSVYHNLPLDGALRLLRENEGRFVLVAIPCQLEGIYNYVLRCEPALRSRIHATIGLVCGWNYTHHSLRAICAYKGIDFEAITDIAYRGDGPVGRLRITTPAGTTSVHRRVDFSYQVAFDRSFNVARCHVCVNHCNYLADIVVGDAWLPSTVGTKSGISLVIARRGETEAVLSRLAERGAVRVVRVGPDEITESQSRRIIFGDFAYAYADYLREIGEHCPDMAGPNRAKAKPAARGQVAGFHRGLLLKRRLQREGKYRTLWFRKATVEAGPFVMRYVRWFFVRVLKIKSLLGLRREVASDLLKDFR